MIVIVGGGVMGCTLLYTLARRGERVMLVERGRSGEQGASSVPVALLNPYRGRSGRASAFDLHALERMWALVAELEAQGLTTGVRPSGVLRLASNAKQAKTWRKRDGVRWLEPNEIENAYHAPFGGFLVPQGGFLEPRVWLRALVAAAKKYGATVLEDCEVHRISAGSTLETTLETSAGRLEASRVVLCSGQAMGLGQETLGLEAVAGEVIELEQSEVLPYPLAGAVYGATLGNSFFLGGNHRPALTDDAQAPILLRRAGGWFIPGLREAQILSVWHGVRAKTVDNLPLIRELQPGLWFAGALAGRGFLCAAAVAETLAVRLEED